MKIDVVSIFPDYLAPLGLSLVGKAQESGLLELEVHDLRTWAHDKHRTVDDTPAGGGAGMVMRADIWGASLDDVLTEGAILVIPTPSGDSFTQRVAEELATAQHLVFACGRYEGIDSRVADEYRSRGIEVRELSIGDYVLNGGEVAALAMVEAVGRLIPGVVGNPESLVEESHSVAGLLEYPVYTRPVQWREHVVPEILFGGHHANIARWRRDRALERTVARRPDMIADLESAGGLDKKDRAVLADYQARVEAGLETASGMEPADPVA